MKRKVSLGLCVLCFAAFFTGCLLVPGQQAPTSRIVNAPNMDCERANKLGYETVTTMGYLVTSVQPATLGQPGYILAHEGRKDGRLTISCHPSGAVFEAAKADGVSVSLVGPSEAPGEFPAMFDRAFNIMRNTQDVMAKREPAKGMAITLTRLNGYESKIELGSDLVAGGMLPVKIVINNNTPRTYGLEVDKIFLQAAGGGRVAPLASPAAGRGKTLQGNLTLAPGQTVTGYLFYPAGTYSSGSTTIVDKENDEREGFSIQF